MDTREDRAEHQVVETKTLSYNTCSQRLTCSRGREGHRNNWTDSGHGTDIPPLPAAPEPPRMSREERLIALYGETRGRRRHYAEQRARAASR